jgi:hypothetical protein
MSTKTSRPVLGGLAALIVALALAPAVPAATNADGSADLSICGHDAALRPSDTIDLRQFAQRLHGTWLLRRRTIQGITIATDSKFYFDIDTIGDGQASGHALMLDRGNLSNMDPLERCKACLADATVGALWKVDIRTQADGKTVALTMDGDYLGSYGDFAKGLQATEKTVFMRQDGTYLAGNLFSPAGGQGLPDDMWDRISLTDDVLVYVSCRSRFVDRFVKLTSGKPLIDGLKLPEAWEVRKKDGSLLNPSLARKQSR